MEISKLYISLSSGNKDTERYFSLKVIYSQRLHFFAWKCTSFAVLCELGKLFYFLFLFAEDEIFSGKIDQLIRSCHEKLHILDLSNLIGCSNLLNQSECSKIVEHNSTSRFFFKGLDYPASSIKLFSLLFMVKSYGIFLFMLKFMVKIWP